MSLTGDGEQRTLDLLGLAHDIAITAAGRPLADELYARWWVALRAIAPAQASVAFPQLSALRAAHAGSYVYEPGWLVAATDHGPSILVSRSGEWRWLGAGDVINEVRPGAPAQPGERVRVVMRRDTVDQETGYWQTWAAAGPPAGALLRFYFNASPSAAVRVVGALTRALARLEMRFQMKCSSRADRYERTDSMVLYVRQGDWETVRQVIREIVAVCGSALRADVPPLALPLAPGVGLAEDVSATESFGSQRCRLIARGFGKALARHAGRDEAVQSAVRALRGAGIPLDRPWLNSARGQEYAL